MHSLSPSPLYLSTPSLSFRFYIILSFLTTVTPYHFPCICFGLQIWLWAIGEQEACLPLSLYFPIPEQSQPVVFWDCIQELHFRLLCWLWRLLHPLFIGRTDAEAETPILWPPHAKSWLIWKDPDPGKDWGQEEKWMTEDETVGWHHWLNGREFE